MGGQGAVGAWGLAGLQDAIRQRLADQLKQRQIEQEMQLAERRQKLAESELEMRGKEHAMGLANSADARAWQQHVFDTQEGGRLNESIPPGTDLPETGMISGQLRLAGVQLPLKGITAEEPPPALAALDNGPAAMMPGTIGNAPMLRGRLVQKPASAAQQNTLADNARADLAAKNSHEDRRLAAEDRKAQTEAAAQARIDAAALANTNHQDFARLAASLKPPPADNLVKVEHKGPDGRTIIEYLPKSEVRGKTYEKGVGSATETRLASAQAVNQTGDDIIAQLSDPQVASSLGVAMGRYSNLQDFIGNPPPEFSELAGSIESYALANMGVHGMRSAQGAEQIKRMLSQPHTPASLIAAVKGLNKFSQHFMENEGRSSTAPGKTGTGGAPKQGDTKTFPNGAKAVFDGTGWVKQ